MPPVSRQRLARALLLTAVGVLLHRWRVPREFDSDARSAPRAVRTPSARPLADVVHVAPWGDDARGDGSARRPVASPRRAQAIARSRLREGLPTVEVRLAAGRYALAAPLALGAADAGARWVGAGANRTTLSGGRAVTGWRRVRALGADADGGGRALALFAARAPPELVEAGGALGAAALRQLYARGGRLPRSRLPASELEYGRAERRCAAAAAAGRAADAAACGEQLARPHAQLPFHLVLRRLGASPSACTVLGAARPPLLARLTASKGSETGASKGSSSIATGSIIGATGT